MVHELRSIVKTLSCTIQLGSLCFRERKLPRKLISKQNIQSSYVHVWGAISFRGAALIVIFSGIMDAIHGDILNALPVPFIVTTSMTIKWITIQSIVVYPLKAILMTKTLTGGLSLLRAPIKIGLRLSRLLKKIFFICESQYGACMCSRSHNSQMQYPISEHSIY